MAEKLSVRNAPKLALLAAPVLAVVGLVMVMTPSGAASGSSGSGRAVAAVVAAPTERPTPSPAAPEAPVEVQALPESGSVSATPPSAASADSRQTEASAPQMIPPKIVEPSPECAAALAAVEGAGLDLPDGTAFRCPGSTEQSEGDRQHSGVACWGNRRFCPGGSYIAINPEHTASGAHHLRYVVAHEICHIHAFLVGARGGTEAAADACAAQAGFPRP